MNKILLLSGLLAMLAPLAGRGQGYYQPGVASPYDRYTTYQVSARYTVGLPLAGFRTNYIDQLSLRGLTLSGEWLFPGRFSAGVQAGYQSFDQRLPRQTYRLPDGSDVSAVQTRTYSATPVTVFGKYHLGTPSATVRPYVQVCVGGSINRYALYYGTLEDSENKVNFLGNAALGSRFLFGKQGNFGADVQVGFQYAPVKNYLKEFSTLNASVGLVYRWW